VNRLAPLAFHLGLQGRDGTKNRRKCLVAPVVAPAHMSDFYIITSLSRSVFLPIVLIRVLHFVAGFLEPPFLRFMMANCDIWKSLEFLIQQVKFYVTPNLLTPRAPYV